MSQRDVDIEIEQPARYEACVLLKEKWQLTILEARRSCGSHGSSNADFHIQGLLTVRPIRPFYRSIKAISLSSSKTCFHSNLRETFRLNVGLRYSSTSSMFDSGAGWTISLLRAVGIDGVLI